MFIASGHLAFEDGGRLVRKSLGLVAAVVVGECRRGTHLTTYIYALHKTIFQDYGNSTIG